MRKGFQLIRTGQTAAAGARRVGILEGHLLPTALRCSTSCLTRSYVDSQAPLWKTVHLTATGVGPRTVSRVDEGHDVVTDQPKKAGGTGTAASPLPTLLASLAGCEQATAMFYARQMRMNVESITFDIEGDYDVRGFRGVEGVPARFQKVRIKATVKTDGTQEQVNELEQVVSKRCPVAALFQDAGVAMDVSWTKA